MEELRQSESVLVHEFRGRGSRYFLSFLMQFIKMLLPFICVGEWPSANKELLIFKGVEFLVLPSSRSVAKIEGL